MDSLKHSYKAEDRELYSLAVCNVGYETCKSGKQWGPGVRDHYLIHHVTAGRGTYAAGGKEYHLKAGDTFLIYPREEVRYQADREFPWEYYWVGFYGGDAGPLLEATDFKPDCPVISTDFGDRLKRVLLDLYRSAGTSQFHHMRMEGYLYLALSLMMEGAVKASEPGEAGPSYVRMAEEIIAGSYARDVTVEEIADKVGISRSHLFRVFKEYYGLSPKEYLTDFRMKKACQLLRETGLSIGTVACSVGIEDNFYFSRVFRRMLGTTPREYREKNRRKEWKEPSPLELEGKKAEEA